MRFGSVRCHALLLVVHNSHDQIVCLGIDSYLDVAVWWYISLDFMALSLGRQLLFDSSLLRAR
jgi:hypothetical protein